VSGALASASASALRQTPAWASTGCGTFGQEAGSVQFVRTRRNHAANSTATQPATVQLLMQQNEKNRFSSLVITNAKKIKVKTATKNNEGQVEI
jgi:hypothetical protein